MGRSYAFTYEVRVEEFRVKPTVSRCYTEPMGWDCKHAGRPSLKALENWVWKFEESTREGGVNAHLGERVITHASIVRCNTKEIVASYTAPLFRVQ